MGTDCLSKARKGVESLGRIDNQVRRVAVSRQASNTNADLRTRNAEVVRQSELSRVGMLPDEISLSLPEADDAWDLFDCKYELLDVIGHGEFGSVYRARHATLDRIVAIKIIRPDVRMRSVDIERVRFEGLSACWVEHENAISIWDGGVTSTGYTYVVMEVLSGHSLRDEITRYGALGLARSLWIARSICAVLATAYAAGVVHREIKPENIFLHTTETGEEIVKVLNFGIAKLMDTAKPAPSPMDRPIITAPEYVAPERILEGVYSGRSDIYSTGCILYEMLTGKAPAAAEREMPELTWQMNVAMPLRPIKEIVPDLPEYIATLVHATLENDPEDRPSAMALFLMLEEAVDYLDPLA